MRKGVIFSSYQLQYYRIYLKFWTSYLLTVLVLNFNHLTTCSCAQNISGLVVNSVNPDQMPHSIASDLGVHCLLSAVCLNTWGKYGIELTPVLS